MEQAEVAVNSEQEFADAMNLLKETKEEIEETREEVQEAQQEPVEPKEEEQETVTQSEKSRLGRKVKRLEDTLMNINQTLEILKERTVAQPVQQQVEPEYELPENATADELKEYLRHREQVIENRVLGTVEKKQFEEANRVKNYGEKYAKLILDNVDPEEDPDLYELLTGQTPFNAAWSKYTNPEADFAKNIAAATREVLGRSKAPRPNVKGARPPAVNVPTTTAKPKGFDLSKLSPDERGVAEHLSEADLKRIFGNR